MLALAPRVASKELLPVIHNTVGGILGKSGDVIGAAREYEIALVERQKLPPSGDRSFELAGLAWARLQLCDLDGARTAALEGLAALRDGDRPRDEAMLRIYLAEVHAAAGDPGGADREYRLAESLSASAGDDWTGLTTGLSRANVWTSQGRLEEVERVIPELLAGATAQGRLDAEIVARIIQARCFAGLEQAGEAEAALTVAKVKLSEQGNQNRFYLLHLAITDGLVQSALGRHSEASRLLEEAIRSARDGGLVQLELEARLELGRAELRTGLEAGRARLQALLQEARLRGAGAIVRSVDQLMRAT
jgi:tetratricopeptide (TPR) repeat protein